MIVDLTHRYSTAAMTAAQTKEIEHRQLLARASIRPTRQRLGVLAALSAEPNDSTAQDVHEWLRRSGEPTGLATVYRTLALLSERGIVDALAHHPGELCYRLCSSDGHHHHLVCDRCHKVVELGGCDLEGWLEQLGAAHGFTVTAHSVEVAGLCADCS